MINLHVETKMLFKIVLCHYKLYHTFDFIILMQDISELPNPGGSVQWPKERYGHSSVLINGSRGPHLLVVGGHPLNSWLFDINKRTWKPLVSICMYMNGYCDD